MAGDGWAPREIANHRKKELSAAPSPPYNDAAPVPEAMEFYYWLANCFCDADTVGDGNVRITEFAALVDKAAAGAIPLIASRSASSGRARRHCSKKKGR